MPYAEISHIQAEFKSIEFDENTMITTAEVERYATEADVLIDSRLALKYKTPVTGPQSLILVRLIATWLVKGRILSIMRVKSGNEPTDQEGSDPSGKANKMLDDLVSGKMILPDQDLVNNADGIKSYSYNNDIEHVFDVTKTQW